ncbi:hypothetical protein B0H14DRAFT_2607539 [Mycena olivaceomarginata]|nr:hypothetical protein B0H14DRAFT_2607539 [Mycena olivaceomarginata]
MTQWPTALQSTTEDRHRDAVAVISPETAAGDDLSSSGPSTREYIAGSGTHRFTFGILSLFTDRPSNDKHGSRSDFRAVDPGAGDAGGVSGPYACLGCRSDIVGGRYSSPPAKYLFFLLFRAGFDAFSASPTNNLDYEVKSPAPQGSHIVPSHIATHDTVAPRWKTPPLSFRETATWDFQGRIGNAHSIIREYFLPEGVLYLVAAGRNRLGCAVVAHRLTLHELAAEVFAQMRDPALAQLVWGHGTVIRHQDPGALLESRFIVTEKRIPLEGGGEFAYDFYLVKKTREDMLLDYVYAVLAVLYRLPKKSQRFAYLEHQEYYLYGDAFAEWTALSEANIDICFESGIPLDQVLLQARERIQKLMSSFSVSIMGDAVNLSPSWELQRAALDVGSSVYLWSMNTSRAFVLHGQTVNMDVHGSPAGSRPGPVPLYTPTGGLYRTPHTPQ